jgi:hypothetical protein
LAVVAEVAGTVEDVLLWLGPLHALRTSAMIVALMTEVVVLSPSRDLRVTVLRADLSLLPAT